MGGYWSEMTAAGGMNRAAISSGTFQFIKEFGVLNLGSTKEYVIEAGPYETGLLIFDGICDVEIDGSVEKGVGARESVFAGLPTAVYVPAYTQCTIRSSRASIGVCRAGCTEKTTPAIIRQDQVKVMQVGKDNWSREVRIILGPESPSVNMILGETLNPPGNWSGTPPHKHEGKLETESHHEELYYYRADKPQGWGIEKLYSPERNVNELIPLKENVVTYKPWGYHQVVAGPGYTLYYLFFLAGKGKKLSGHEDPNHNWIKQ